MDHITPERGDIESGLELARACLLHFADGNDTEALFALNSADEGSVRWTAGYLLAALRETAQILGRNSRPKRTAADLLRSGAAGIDEDVIANQVDDAIQRLTGGVGNA